MPTGHGGTVAADIAPSGHRTTVAPVTAGFPWVDPVGPDGAGLPGAVEVIGTAIALNAAEADRGGVQREAFAALAEAGLHGRPLEPAAAQRELAELIAGSDASTWFCWTQHHSPVRALMRASECGIQHRLLHDAVTGRMLCGVAVAHLRRPGPANPVARRTAHGWMVEGTLDWVTSWDIADWFLLMARVEGEDQILAAMLPAGRGLATGGVPGLVAGDPLRLLSMSGTHTRPLRLERVRLHPEDVLYLEDLPDWRAHDEVKAANANPATFGIARGALADLHAIAEKRSDEVLQQWCADLVEQVRACRRQAYAAADAPLDGAHHLEARRLIRARSLQLAQQATTAVVVAQSGGSMVTGCSAERRAREVLFMHVQAQTTDAAHAYATLARELSPGTWRNTQALSSVP